MSPTSRAWLSGAVVAAALGGAAPADAYVRSVSAVTGKAWFWDHVELRIVADLGQPVKNISSQEITTAVKEAAAAWSHGQNSCIPLRISVSFVDDARTPTRSDRVNRLAFRRVSWCHEPRDPEVACNDPAAIALTTTFTEPSTARIVDADIEVNATDSYVWADRVARPERVTSYDLQNALTHEMGHFLGFAHSCLFSSKDVSITDDGGQPVPWCPGGPEAQESTLFPTVDPTDIARRTLTADDKRGLCEVYGPAIPAGLVQSGGPVGCALARKPSGPAPYALGPLVAGLAIARLRRRRSP